MMSEFLLIVIIGMLVYIIYDRENEKKPKNDKHIVEDILPEMIGKMCEIDFKQWLIYVADVQKRQVVEISQAKRPIQYEEKAIDDYIKTIAANARKMKKEQLLEQFNYILDPSQKAQILSEIVKLENEKESL